MGQLAREHGFSGKFLSALCDVETGLNVGCGVLAAKFSAAEGDVARALGLWNGGANPNYAPEVLSKIDKYRTE